jgi:hypothetical protein
MNQSPDRQLLPTHLKNLARWIVLVPVVLVILFGCGQFALVSAQQPSVEGPLTKMQANYRAWSFTEFQPLADGIMDEILKDRSRYAYGAPPSIVLVSGPVWPTQKAGQQETPLPPAPTAQTTQTLPATQIPQATATVAVTPSATQVLWIPYTATNIPPPEDTRTPTPTATSTATETPVPTAVPPNDVNIGSPDGSIEDIAGGGELIIDLEALTGSPLDTSTPDGAYDLVFYEYEPSAGIIMFDHVVLQVGTGPSGSCGSSTWTTVLYWGDADASNNGQIGNLYPGEADNQSIPFSNLYLGATPGIAIDIDALGASGIYPCLRIYSPVSGDGDSAQVDSIEILP